MTGLVSPLGERSLNNRCHGTNEVTPLESGKGGRRERPKMEKHSRCLIDRWSDERHLTPDFLPCGSAKPSPRSTCGQLTG